MRIGLHFFFFRHIYSLLVKLSNSRQSITMASNKTTTITSIMKRDKVFCSSTLRYQSTRGPDRWSEKNIQAVVQQFDLNPEMEQRLRDLQRRVSDIDHFKNDPIYLVRFLLGSWGHNRAEIMFRKMIDWRATNHVDTIFDDYVPPQILLDCVPSAMLKDYDRDGDPIYVERGGAVDAAGLLKIFSKEELLRYGIWTRERNSNGVWINEYERRRGKSAKEITVVYDLKGLSARHLNPKGIEYFKEIIKITQHNFPSPIKRLIVIRAPRIFTILWNTIKHIFPSALREKMIFLGSTGYLEGLDKYLDINILPPCINPAGSGETAVGMMQHLDGVESVQAYLDSVPDNIPEVSSETEAESFYSEDSFDDDGAVGVTGEVLLRGSWNVFGAASKAHRRVSWHDGGEEAVEVSIAPKI